MGGNADNADAALRAAASLIAFALRRSPSRPSGRVALLSQARRQMLAKLPLILYPATASRACLVVIKGRHKNNTLTRKKASRAFLAAFATATPPVRSDGMASSVKKMRRAKLRR